MLHRRQHAGTSSRAGKGTGHGAGSHIIWSPHPPTPTATAPTTTTAGWRSGGELSCGAEQLLGLLRLGIGEEGEEDATAHSPWAHLAHGRWRSEQATLCRARQLRLASPLQVRRHRAAPHTLAALERYDWRKGALVELLQALFAGLG